MMLIKTLSIISRRATIDIDYEDALYFELNTIYKLRCTSMEVKKNVLE